MEAPDGADVYNAARVRMEHMGQHRLDAVIAASQIHAEDPLPGLGGDILKLLLLRDARVVHQKRHRAQLRLRAADHGVHGLRIRHVGPDGDGPAAHGTELFKQGKGPILPLDIIDAHGPALHGQGLRHRRADAPGGAGDQGGPVRVKIHAISVVIHHFSSQTPAARLFSIRARL